MLAQGAQVTVASGRNLYGIYDLADESGITLPVIAYNGAAIYDFTTGRPLKLFPLQREVTDRLCDLFEQLEIRHKACVFFEEQHRGVTFNQNGYRSILWTDKARHPENGLLYDEPVIDGTREQILSGQCLYIGSSGSYEQIHHAYEQARGLPGVQASAMAESARKSMSFSCTPRSDNLRGIPTSSASFWQASIAALRYSSWLMSSTPATPMARATSR